MRAVSYTHLPYDKYRSELLHRGALCGTSNSIQIITDEENRRYSPWFVDNIESPRDVSYTHLLISTVFHPVKANMES